MISESGSPTWPGDMPSGGVPALADVELTDCGVPARGDSSDLMCSDFLIEAASPSGSAECCRLS